MLKALLYPLLRGISLLLIGILLVACREQTTLWIVVLIGALFFIVGIITVLNYLLRKRRGRPTGPFPLLGIGGMLLGLILMLAASSFIKIFMYVMGGVIVFVGIYQLVVMMKIHRKVKLHSTLFLAPILAVMFGLFALWNPTKAASLPLLMTGLGCVVSGVGDIVATTILGIHLSKENRLARQAASDGNTPSEQTTTNV